ncbi:MAG: SRPBCC domain-containing protein [Pseudomonadota bacterium]|nr:MAG: SRPBCC domain-containing protein [Pseudomonadota bacterium]
MDIAAQTTAASLEIRRTFDAPPERVFAAWTTVEALEKWMGPVDDMVTRVEAYELRVGGKYRFRLITRNDDDTTGPAGTEHVVEGTFVEIRPHQRLAFTWAWVENGMDIGETLVTLDFTARGKQTELVLLHEKLPTDEAHEAHREGWEGCLHCLGKYLDW